MKRIVAMLAVVVMLVGTAGMAVAETNRAEQAGIIADYCKQILEALYKAYTDNGRLSESNIYMAYQYYQTYKAASDLKTVEMGVYVGDMSMVNKTFVTRADMPNTDGLVDEQWVKYLKGETDADTFTYLLMNVSVKIAIEAE